MSAKVDAQTFTTKLVTPRTATRLNPTMWGSLSIDDEEDNTDNIFGSGLSNGGGGGGLWGNFEDNGEAQKKSMI